MHKQAACFLLVLLLFCLCTCSQKQYRDDIACQSLAKDICEKLPQKDGYASFDQNYLSNLFVNQAIPDDFALFYSVDASDINEVFVFRASSIAKAETLRKLVLEYLKDKQENDRAFIASYAPQELAKLDSADVRQFGPYVILCICPPDILEDCMETAKNALIIKQ